MKKLKSSSTSDLSAAYNYLPSALSAAVSVLIFANVVYNILFVGAGDGAAAVVHYLFQMCKFLPLFFFIHLAVKLLPEVTVSGGQIGNELANDEEELAYALSAIAEVGVDDVAVSDFLSGDDRERVRDLCNSIALSLSKD